MIKRIFAMALGVGLWAGFPSFAATYQFSTEVDNTITTGDISITLDEYELDDYNNLTPYRDGKVVMPGQIVSKIVRITNESEPAWIRAKAEFMSKDGINGLGVSMLDVVNGWIYRSGYYYYTQSVDTGKDVIFFKQVQVPSTWDVSYSEKGFSIDVTAQAVQAVQFEPDFESDDPWFGIPIETCIHTDHELYQAGRNSEFAVVFENGSEGFIKIGDDFFKDFGAMMPGETMEDSFILGNQFFQTIGIGFRTEIPDGQSAEALKLLSDLILTITRGDEILYSGPLRADALQSGIMLAPSMEKGMEQTITYSIYMPEELQNASAMQQAKVRWIFSTEYTRTSRGGGEGSRDRDPNPPDTENRSNVPAPEAGSAPETPSPAIQDMIPIVEAINQAIHNTLPKTGDESIRVGVFLTAMFASGSGILLLRSRSRKHKGGQKE